MIQYLHFWDYMHEYTCTDMYTNDFMDEYLDLVCAKYPVLWYNVITYEVSILNELFEEIS